MGNLQHKVIIIKQHKTFNKKEIKKAKKEKVTQ